MLTFVGRYLRDCIILFVWIKKKFKGYAKKIINIHSLFFFYVLLLQFAIVNDKVNIFWEQSYYLISMWMQRDLNPQPLSSSANTQHLTKLAKSLSCVISTYLYGEFDGMFLSCHVRVSEGIHTLYCLNV